MIEDNDLLSRIEQAISDPGSVLPRRAEPPFETRAQWCARAVQDVIKPLTIETAQWRTNFGESALRDRRLPLPSMLAQFHAGFGQSFGDGGSGNAERSWMHNQEHDELIEALASGDPVAVAHELADNVYLAYGTAHSLGIFLDEALVLVHRANMSKAGPDGRFTLDEHGKVVKPTDFVPADVSSCIRPTSCAAGEALDDA